MPLPKKSVLKTRARKMGLRLLGDFIIMHCGDCVISGIAMDYPPNSPRLWTFLLPKFDDTSFLYLTMGGVIKIPDDSADVLIDAIQVYNSTISNIRTAYDLIDYVDRCPIRGDVDGWVKYLCAIWLGNYDDAEGLEKVLDNERLSTRIENLYPQLRQVRIERGWNEARNVLISWAEETDARYCRK